MYLYNALGPPVDRAVDLELLVRGPVADVHLALIGGVKKSIII